MTATTFDPNLMSGSGMALSGGNLTATATAAASVGATRSCSGPSYFQITLGSSIGTAQLVGLVNRAFAFGTTLLGADGSNNSVGYKSSDGTVKINNTIVSTIQTSAANAVVDVAYNPDTQLIWFRTNNGNWNNDVIANQNPAGNVGGISTVSLRGALYPAWGAAATGNSAAAVFTSGFTNAPPTGYVTVDTIQCNPYNSTVPKSASYTTIGAAHKSTVASATRTVGWIGRTLLAPANTVSGVVKENGVAVSGRTVAVFDTRNNWLLGMTTSDGSGNWSIPGLGRASVYAVALDPTTYQAQVFDRVAPV